MKINNTRKRHFSRPFGNSCHHHHECISNSNVKIKYNLLQTFLHFLNFCVIFTKSKSLLKRYCQSRMKRV